MTTTMVHGTALQAAIDAAMPYDRLVCDPVGYAGVITIPKPLDLVSDGGSIEAPAIDGKINVVIASRDVHVDGFDYTGGGLSVQYRGNVTGSSVTNFHSYRVDNMVRNTPGIAGDDNGGNHFSWFRSTGGEFGHGETHGGRAPSFDYGRDGGAFEVFGGSVGGYAHDIVVNDAVNLTEWGRLPTDSDNGGFIFRDITVHGRRHPLDPPPVLSYPGDPTHLYRRADVGAFLRAVNGVLFERVEFDQLDDYAALLEIGTGFAGGAARVEFRDCTWRLKPGVARMMVLKGGVSTGAVSVTGATIFPNGSTELALINGNRLATLAQLQALGWDIAYFGAEPAPDPRDRQISGLQALADTRLAMLNDSAATVAALETESDAAHAALRASIAAAQKGLPSG